MCYRLVKKKQKLLVVKKEKVLKEVAVVGRIISFSHATKCNLVLINEDLLAMWLLQDIEISKCVLRLLRGIGYVNQKA